MKKFRKILAAILVVCMCATLLPMQILATGLTTVETSTTTTTTDANGNIVVTVTVNKTTTGTDETGATVNREETRTDTTISSEYGYEYGSTWTEDGTEHKEWTEEDDGSAAGQPKVEVELKPGESTSANTTSTTTTSDANGTTTTTSTDRTVGATTSDVTTSVNDSNSGLVSDEEAVLRGPRPVYDADDNLHTNASGVPVDKVNGEHVGKEGVFDRNYLSSDSKYNDPSKWTNVPEEADFRYVGTGEHSKFFTARVTVTYLKDENGNPVMDEDGNYVIESLTKADGTPITINGVPTTELPDQVSLKPIYDDYNGSRPTTFMLIDKNGNQVFGYCCDMDTSTVKGSWYSVTNLEDSNYYASEESEEHIRTIVMNGYWGTSDVPKADGTYEFGSLEGIKAKLKAAIENGEMENEVITMTVTGEDGEEVEVTKTMMELLDELTEGEALLATQSAIWAYSNGSINVKNGKDGVILVDPDGYKWNHDPSANSKDGEALDDFGSARVDFLYKWLVALEGEESSTVVINDKNFVEDMSLTVGDKVGMVEGTDNGIYDTALNFKLAFIPGANDDLLVQISYTDLDGNLVNIVKRLAGTNAEGQDFATILPDENGNYVISGLKLSENEDFNFDLRLEGTQYLENGVYVYQAVGGREVSQTFVGVAEGERNVDVSLGVTIRFDVDENNYVVADREWHGEGDPVNIPPTTPPTTPPTNDNPPPVTTLYNIDEEEVPLASHLSVNNELVEILDEEVPLAAVPETGDHSVILILAIIATTLLLGATFIFDKKRAHQA